MKLFIYFLSGDVTPWVTCWSAEVQSDPRKGQVWICILLYCEWTDVRLPAWTIISALLDSWALQWSISLHMSVKIRVKNHFYQDLYSFLAHLWCRWWLTVCFDTQIGKIYWSAQILTNLLLNLFCHIHRELINVQAAAADRHVCRLYWKQAVGHISCHWVADRTNTHTLIHELNSTSEAHRTDYFDAEPSVLELLWHAII